MKKQVLFVFAIIAALSSQAAVITWQTPVTISGDTDVDLTGTLDRAYNFGSNGGSAAVVPSTTVNSVTFAPFGVDANFGLGSANSWTVGQTTLAGAAAQNVVGYDNFDRPNNPYNSLSSSYKDLLKWGAYSFDANNLTLTLGGLTIGKQYLFQFWVDDSRGVVGNRQETLVAGNTSGSLSFNNLLADGGVGQYVIGTFTANSTSQAITINSTTAQANAFQLRDITVPEPSTLLLFGGGCLVMGCVRRRLGQ